MITAKDVKKNRKLFSEADVNVAAFFKVLSDVKRYRIFRILTIHPKLSVSNIAKILDISLPLASQHIKILTQANLLQKERDGKHVFPKLEYTNPFVKTFIAFIQRGLE